MKTELVNNYRELRGRIRELANEQRGAKLVFRGQVDLHKGSVVPSIARPGSEDYHRDQHPFWYTIVSDMVFDRAIKYQEWLLAGRDQAGERQHSPGPKIGDDAVRPGTLGSQIERLLQHYGARSHYIDVTTSLRVALWFAHHTHHIHDLPLLPMDVPDLHQPLDPYGPMPVYDVAWYEPAWPKKGVGYFFVLAPTLAEAGKPLRHGDFIDLNPNYMAERISRQQAGLIYADTDIDAESLRRFVLGIFRFALPLSGAPNFVTTANTHALFPSPDRDIAYSEILARIPFRNEIELPFALRRVLRIPEYYDKAHAENLGSAVWRAFRKYDCYRPRTLLFPVLVDKDDPALVCTVDGTEIHLRNATPVLGPLSISFVMEPTSPQELAFSDHGAGLFFEFDPVRAGVVSEERIAPENPHGIWIVRNGDSFWCRVFGMTATDEETTIHASSGHWFVLEEGKGITFVGEQPQPGSFEEEQIAAEREHLGIALSLLFEVFHGRRELKPSPVQPYLVLTEEHVEL
jgi:hypothetical protein